MKTSVSAADTTATFSVPAKPESRPKTKRATKQEFVAAPTARKGTKGALIVTMLQKPTGASLTALMKATGWQAHSVRAFLSAYVGKRLGLKVTSSEKEGKRVYAVKK
jgi:hypothetical protein